MGIDILRSKHWRIRGIEVTNAFSAGIRMAESEAVVLSHAHVHDNDGIDNDNIAGVTTSAASRTASVAVSRTASATGPQITPGRPTSL